MELRDPSKSEKSTTREINRTEIDNDLSTRPRWRRWLIVLFAIVLLSIATVSQAQNPNHRDTNHRDTTDRDTTDPSPALLPEPAAGNHPATHQSAPPLAGATDEADDLATIQYDGVIHQVPVARATPEHLAAVAELREATRKRQSLRPRYATLTALLANFDADADPDGWRAEVTILDSNDRHVTARANAIFELMPRAPMADHISYIDAAKLPVRWSMNLKFDDDGVARVKLPLRQPLRPILGWSSAAFPRNASTLGARTITRRGFDRNSVSFTDATNDWRNELGRPLFGELSVRVSVPTEGVFRAVTVVPIRPTVLVDTNWPYR